VPSRQGQSQGRGSLSNETSSKVKEAGIKRRGEGTKASGEGKRTEPRRMGFLEEKKASKKEFEPAAQVPEREKTG
jgi:hypothetical protein